MRNGEVDDASILANKETTKSYWEAKLLEAAENQKNSLFKNIAADSLTQAIASSVGQSAANMLVTPDSKTGRIEPVDLDSKDLRNVVSPPPEFRLENKAAPGEVDRRQYVYGENGELESPSSAIPRHVNIIEQEIREQQLREAQLRQESAIKSQQLDIDAGTEADDEGHDREFEDSGCAEFQEFDPTAPVVTPSVKIPIVASTPMVVRPASPIDDDTGIESVGTPTIPTDPLSDDLSPPSTYFDPCQFSTEAKIALEIRELKEREEELRRMRTRFQSGSMHSQDNMISLPTSHSTDEGNCSEYGSGEDASNKEVASIEGGGSSRLTSPEIPSNGLGFLHQRTQSMDSVSSGHSSTPSNGVAHPTPGMALAASYADFYSKRRVTVKPLADPEDEEESSYKPLKETPMEREIRLAREREEELRRIRAYQTSIQQQPKAAKATTPTIAKTLEKERHGFDFSGKTEVYAERGIGGRQKTIATSRIQQEIAEQEEREKSLMLHHTDKMSPSQEEKMILSHDCEQAKKEQEAQPKMAPVVTETDSVQKPAFIKSQTANQAMNSAASRGARRLAGYAGLHKLMNPPTSPIGTPSTKGLMEKFLASRGKMPTVVPTFSTPEPVARAAKAPAVRPAAAKPDPLATVPKLDDVDNTLRRQQSAGAAKPKQTLRRAFATAEEKIQLELQEMKMREKELRDQRMKALARSQPNLLAAFDDEEEESDVDEIRPKNGYPRLCDNGLMMNGGSSMPQRCQSNPNLLDDDAASTVSDASCSNLPSQQGRPKAPRRKSALIAQWESMIQQQTGATINEDN